MALPNPVHSSSTGHTPLAQSALVMPNVSRYQSQNTKPPELRFRALLSDGTPEVRFERVAAGQGAEKPL